MNDTLKKLHAIGIDEIHSLTHISIHSLSAILEERFSDISHIQYTGFLSLIEPEVKFDLTELRDSYTAYQEETGQNNNNRALFVASPVEEKSNKALIIFIIAAILGLLFVYTMPEDTQDETKILETKLENSAIEDAAKNLSSKVNVKTPITDTITEVGENIATFNASQAIKDENTSKNTHPFVMYPKEALWVGIIDMDTEEQRDTITSAPYVLDENANLLISLGHGMVRIELNSDVTDLSDNGRIRYLYKNGKLNRISLERFKELNKGKSW